MNQIKALRIFGEAIEYAINRAGEDEGWAINGLFLRLGLVQHLCCVPMGLREHSRGSFAMVMKSLGQSGSAKSPETDFHIIFKYSSLKLFSDEQLVEISEHLLVKYRPSPGPAAEALETAAGALETAAAALGTAAEALGKAAEALGAAAKALGTAAESL